MASESNPDPLEIVAAVLLGLAVVAIGWSTYQSALWGGVQDESYTESVRQANDAVDLLQAGDTIRSLDQGLFVAVVASQVCDGGELSDESACQRLLVGMSDPGAAATDEWVRKRDTNPFQSPSYLEAIRGEGEEARLASDRSFVAAGQANENGDNYELAATILTAVLFFAGISVVLSDRRIRWALLAAASLLLVGATAYVVTLPVA